jgi:hypothetical protein
MDRQLLYFASVVGLCVQILLEYIRLHRISPIAGYLDSGYEIFVDDKDSGFIVLGSILRKPFLAENFSYTR